MHKTWPQHIQISTLGFEMKHHHSWIYIDQIVKIVPYVIRPSTNNPALDDA